MSNATKAALKAFAMLGLQLVDNAPPAFTLTPNGNLQLTAPRVLGQFARFTTIAAGGIAMLPSLKTLEGGQMIVIINDAPVNSLSLYAYRDAAGTFDTLNGATSAIGAITGRAAIAPGAIAICLPQQFLSQAGGNGTQNLGNWSVAFLT